MKAAKGKWEFFVGKAVWSVEQDTFEEITAQATTCSSCGAHRTRRLSNRRTVPQDEIDVITAARLMLQKLVGCKRRSTKRMADYLAGNAIHGTTVKMRCFKLEIGH